jgi:hypothetical protein
MLFMVIETFEKDDMVPIYRHIRDHGRGLPEGLEVVDSYIEPGFSRCFQVMRTDDVRTLQAWILQFRGLGARFEIVPVVPSAETREVVAPFLEAGPDRR